MFEYGTFRFKEVDSEDLLRQVFRLRYEVYALEFGFENPYDFPDKLEKDAYDSHSIHFVSINEYDEVIGTVRMILDSEKGFPVEHASEITRFKDKPAPRHLTEISRLAVSKNMRRRPEDGIHGVESYIPRSQGGVSDLSLTSNPGVEKRKKPAIILGLYKIVYLKCKELGISHMYMITEDKLYHALYKFGFVFIQIGPSIEYHGKRTPYATSWHTIETHMHEQHPDLLQFLTLGLDKRARPEFPA
ncbi:MAG: PEP-CTERM/exosortase system-associated acyltransferase [Desulfobacter sp.]|nr:MAG: PEP-CTERM/exosortase system-associated acyltransferase [Desulfobacter sp.]